MTAVDSLIKTNPSSYSNIYLIDKYYVQDSLPDYNHIDRPKMTKRYYKRHTLYYENKND